MESFTRGYTGYKDHLVDEAFKIALRLSLKFHVSGYIH